MNISKSLLKTLAQKDFWAFCVYYDNDFFFKRPFLWSVAQTFQEVVNQYKQGNAITVAVLLLLRA